MKTSRLKILVLDDEADICALIRDHLTGSGHTVYAVQTTQEATTVLSQQQIDIAFCDVKLGISDGITFFTNYKKTNDRIPALVFLSGDSEQVVFERVKQLGPVQVIEKPFTGKELDAAVHKISTWQSDPVSEIMNTVQMVSGVQLGSEKRHVVETRLTRRMRQLGLQSLEEYCDHVNKNRESEIQALLSLLTTHTTEFFRESDHYDKLENELLPKLLATKKEIKIWSAACSRGQEVYTLAITVAEYFRKNRIDPNQYRVTFVGTDVDPLSLKVASGGVYREPEMQGIKPEIMQRYFDVGKGELKGYYRVKDAIYKQCKFAQENLLNTSYNQTGCDIIFLRNVLIYFDMVHVQRIATRMAASLKDDGFLFLGHSESFSNFDSPFTSAGVAVYKKKASRSASVTPMFENPSSAEKKHESSKTSTSLSSSSQGAGVGSPLLAVSMVGAPPKDPNKKIGILIVDDSKTLRMVLRKVLSENPEFEVLGEAENPIIAEKMVADLNPDVITLDINMPEMDGITYLEQVKDRPRPSIIMVSATSESEAATVFKCLELGAFDYIEKPKGALGDFDRERIYSSIRTAGENSRKKASPKAKVPKAQPLAPVASDSNYNFEKNQLIAIGSSTGGVEALRNVLPQFKPPCPPILIVQHIPPMFSAALAKRLSTYCAIKVVEGSNGMRVEHNTAYIAPGGQQMKVEQEGDKLVISVNDDPQLNHHKPSVDYLLASLLPLTERYQMAAAILTGMGADGAKNLKALRDKGVHTVAQDEETCVVFGMPGAAVKLGAAVEVAPLNEVPLRLLRAFGAKKTRRAS